MGVDGPLADDERIRDLSIRQATSYQRGNFSLARTESGCIMYNRRPEAQGQPAGFVR